MPERLRTGARRMSYKVFLSHNTSDGEWAKWIAQQAQLVGIEVYLYEHDPQPGVSIAAKVQQQIREADALVVLLTRLGQSSPYVQQEIGYAEAAHRLIIAIVWPGVKPAVWRCFKEENIFPSTQGIPRPRCRLFSAHFRTRRQRRNRGKQFSR